jgi:hypothetical protein
MSADPDGRASIDHIKAEAEAADNGQEHRDQGQSDDVDKERRWCCGGKRTLKDPNLVVRIISEGPRRAPKHSRPARGLSD